MTRKQMVEVLNKEIEDIQAKYKEFVIEQKDISPFNSTTALYRGILVERQYALYLYGSAIERLRDCILQHKDGIRMAEDASTCTLGYDNHGTCKGCEQESMCCKE